MKPRSGGPIARDWAGHDWAAASRLQTCLVFRKLMADAISYMRRPLRGENPNPQQNQDSILAA
jgi:hypothetical protein